MANQRDDDADVPPAVAVLTLTEGQKVAVYQMVKSRGRTARYEAVMVVTDGVLKLRGEWKLANEDDS